MELLLRKGYFCQSGATVPTPESSEIFLRNGPCPVGHYCPAGSLTPVPCPAGSIRNATGTSFRGVSMQNCFACPAGHYCSSDGLAIPSGPCSAGFYCPFDFSSTTPYAFLWPFLSRGICNGLAMSYRRIPTKPGVRELFPMPTWILL
ncbi:hypothetical protein GOODEAATRI_013162 [Goodea atripinnis]|uniref:Uncharacterized protein n=1 Tax=Goodea atripinnis TaxID=208336 RepID=A0ABV0NCM2_9TELE